MKNKLIKSNPITAVNDELNVILNDDELKQLAKFLDALLEIDIANKSSASKRND